MASEATVNCSLQLRKGSLDYQSRPGTFRADVATAGGPTPGTVTCSTAGTSIDLSQLTQPGLCRVQNLDADNYVEVGVWDPELLVFYPFLELLPGESFVVRLSRNFGEEYTSPGTGTGTSSATNLLRVKANTASCKVLVEAFES